MGFLDHSTNNIIIDAVLTDHGRKLLAENQGAFKIAFFSLSDDEVDYTTIRKFGRTVGKEKISKNTPVFEAQTASSHAMKHRLITLPDPLVNKMPTIEFSISSGEASLNPAMGTNAIMLSTNNSATLLVKQQMPGAQSVPIGLTDTTYTVLINSRFLALGGTANLIDTQANSKIASYTIPAATVNDNNASEVSIVVLRKALDDTTFTQFGDNGSGGTQITSILSVVGDQSGLRKDIKVTIKSVTS